MPRWSHPRGGLDASQLMRVCCMGVIEDDGAATTPVTTSPTSQTGKEGIEKHAKDVQVKEKDHRRKSTDIILRSFDVKRYRHKSEEKTVDIHRIIYHTLPKQKSEEVSSPRVSPRKNSEKSSPGVKSPTKRFQRKLSPDKSDSNKIEEIASQHRKSIVKPTDFRNTRKISPSERRIPIKCPKNERHSRHTSDSGDVKSYRSDFFDGRGDTRPSFVRSLSVKSPRGGADNRASTLRCGCKVEDNRDLETGKKFVSLEGSRCTSSTLISPRQRKASPSPHMRPGYRRG